MRTRTHTVARVHQKDTACEGGDHESMVDDVLRAARAPHDLHLNKPGSLNQNGFQSIPNNRRNVGSFAGKNQTDLRPRKSLSRFELGPTLRRMLNHSSA